MFKVARLGFSGSVYDDFLNHYRIQTAFEKYEGFDTNCRVPKVLDFIRDNNDSWWNANRHLFVEIPQDLHLPAMTIMSERIPPLPRIIRQPLILKFCPSEKQQNARENPTNRDCLARVYLGKRIPPDAPLAVNFTLRNYNLTLDQMLAFSLPVDGYAKAMGEALALLHWEAFVDAFDVEFVLGSETTTDLEPGIMQRTGLTPEEFEDLPLFSSPRDVSVSSFTRRKIRMWLLDFNLCSRFSMGIFAGNKDAVIEQYVDSFFENDPYYPRPVKEFMAGEKVEQTLWKVFVAAYLETSKRIMKMKVNDPTLEEMPERFIEDCEKTPGRQKSTL